MVGLMQVLILTNKDSLNNLLAEHLRDQFRAKTFVASTLDAAKKEIEFNNQFNLVIIKNPKETELVDSNSLQSNDGETELTKESDYASRILNALYDQSLDTPVIIIGEYDSSFQNYECISDRLRLEELNRVIIKRLKLKKEDYAHIKLPDYVSIPIKDLLALRSVPCDLFIKLNRKDGDDYLKRFKEGDDFSVDDIKTYQAAGVNFLYVRKDERDAFYQGLTKETLVIVKDLASAEVKEKIKINSSIFQASSLFMRELGITEGTLHMVETSLKTIQQMVTNESKLGVFLKNLLQSQESYSFKRSSLISALSYQVLPQMDWGSGDQLQQIFLKIHTVSFYHDLGLEEDLHLKILFKEDIEEQNKLTTKERDLVLNHAQKMATLMQGIPKLPQGVDLIVKQHHGQTNGIGFPEKLSSGISPLAIFFIVMEHFSSLILECKDKIQFEMIFDELYKKHTLPSYRKVVDILRDKFCPTYKT